VSGYEFFGVHLKTWRQIRNIDKHMPMRGKMADSMYIVLRIAAMAICLLDAPVMISFPDENNSTVVFGASMRMVIAANLFLL